MHIATSGTIAKLINDKSSQAVGQALKRNPWSIDLKNVSPQIMVPCHRIVASNGSIEGFSRQPNGIQVSRKVKLLKKEGVKFILNERTIKYALDLQMKTKMITKFRKIVLKRLKEYEEPFVLQFFFSTFGSFSEHKL